MKILLTVLAVVCIVIHFATDNVVASCAALVFSLMSYSINEDNL
jgi:hypothetical protein